MHSIFFPLSTWYSHFLPQSSDLGLGVGQLHGQVLVGPRLLLLLNAGGVAAGLRAGGAAERANHALFLLHQLRYGLRGGK